VLAAAVSIASDVFGPHFVAAFAIGSLAHGGFAPLASDVDLALILREVSAATGRKVQEVKSRAVKCSPSGLTERLSIFWSDWAGVRDTPGQHCRLPAVDRLDLIDAGRLLCGSDQRSGATPPDRLTLLIEGAQFACTKFDDRYLAALQRTKDLVAGGPRPTTKAVLFPIRFLYTLASGQIGRNDHAVGWYVEHGAHPRVAQAAMLWRHEGIVDLDEAVGILDRELVGVYEEFFSAYINELGSHGATQIADALSVRLDALRQMPPGDPGQRVQTWPPEASA